jgi:hypothetical protein
MNPQSARCPVCDQLATYRHHTRTIGNVYDCLRCGSYVATLEFIQDVPSIIPNPLRPYLSAATREASERDKPITLTTDNWRDLAEQYQRATVTARVDKLLEAIARKSGSPGVYVPLTYENDYPLAGALNHTELVSYLDYLHGEHLVFPNDTSNRGGAYKLSIAGWRAIEPRAEVGGIPGRCFVAMWFDGSMQEAYNLGFAPGVTDAGFTPIRIDEKLTNKGISDEVKAEIRLAQFMVADFTGQRQSVYYEAGFANGLGREVIWCCREDDVSNLHFDTRHLGHVVWKDPADLRTKLNQSIRANIIPKR